MRLRSFFFVLAFAPMLSAQAPAARLRHIVVIFQENVSFDHYFATYPRALNPSGEPAFHALPHTPKVAGLRGALLIANPNQRNPENGEGAANPFRLDRSQAATADQSHAYTAEQKAFHGGRMDLFPKFTGRRGPPPLAAPLTAPLTDRSATDAQRSPISGKGLTMGYFDGNTVTAIWNYAQHYAMSDRFFGSTFGPSTPGALNLVSGQTNGVSETINGRAGIIDGGAGSFTDISDSDPLHDVCSRSGGTNFAMSGPSIGNLLNAANLSWGWFQGGFNLALVNPNGTTGCQRSHHSDITGFSPRDYVPHHEPFQYYASTANPRNLRPASVEAIGKSDDPANHQY
ncbi:MAG: alkaline phosphatase family protein, partial [Terriglobales bacterium]